MCEPYQVFFVREIRIFKHDVYQIAYISNT